MCGYCYYNGSKKEGMICRNRYPVPDPRTLHCACRVVVRARPENASNGIDYHCRDAPKTRRAEVCGGGTVVRHVRSHVYGLPHAQGSRG